MNILDDLSAQIAEAFHNTGSISRFPEAGLTEDPQVSTAQRTTVAPEIDSPLGEDSIFYVLQDLPEAIDPENLKEYTHKIFLEKSGLTVFERYASTADADKPDDKQILIFYEIESEDTNNFFGAACRVKMGSKRFEVMERLFEGNGRITFKESGREITTLKAWIDQIAAKYPEIDPKILLSAIQLEFISQANKNSFFKFIFGLNNALADLMIEGVGGMDSWKFTEKNYEYGKWKAGELDDFAPLLPLQAIEQAQDFLTTGNTNARKAANKGLQQLATLGQNLDNILLRAAAVWARSTPGIGGDVAVFLVGDQLNKLLPEGFTRVLNKVKKLLKEAEGFIHGVIDVLKEDLALINAFLCGLINGIISLLQIVIGLLAFVVDNITILRLENYDLEYFSTQQQKLEFVEDLIDLFTVNVKPLFEGMLKTIVTLPFQLLELIKSIGKEIRGLSQYFWAFLIGAIVFEVILEIAIAFFTGGTANLAKAGARISRLAQKAGEKGVKFARRVSTQVADSTTALLKFLKKEIEELIQAITDGKLIVYIKERILLLFDEDRIDDVISILPENTLSRVASRNKIKAINKALLSSRAVFNPNKPALQKLGVRLFKSKNGLSVDFSKTPKYLYGGKHSKQSVVKIKLKGSRKKDFDAAWKKTGLNNEQIKELDKLYTWHHMDDFDPVTGEATLQLVETFIHGKSRPHLGSVKQIEDFFNIIYK